MSVSKLRSKEESAMATKKTQKKVEQAKPLTMAEALKERLARRNEYVTCLLCCVDCGVVNVMMLLFLCAFPVLSCRCGCSRFNS